MNSEEESYKTQESSSDDNEEYDLCDSEEQFLKRYGKDLDKLKISSEDLICNEDMQKIDKQILCSYTSPTSCNLKAYYAMKHNWVQFFNLRLGNGYYNGNLAITRCQKCSFVIDCWPCKEKRHYSMPPSECPICKGDEKALSSGQYKSYRDIPTRRNWVYYKVNE